MSAPVPGHKSKDRIQLRFKSAACSLLRPSEPSNSYMRLIDSCITQVKARGPSRTCDESEEEEKIRTPDPGSRRGAMTRSTSSRAQPSFAATLSRSGLKECNIECVDGREVSRGENMLYSGTDSESYITEKTFVYENYPSTRPASTGKTASSL